MLFAKCPMPSSCPITHYLRAFYFLSVTKLVPLYRIVIVLIYRIKKNIKKNTKKELTRDDSIYV